MEPDAVLDAWTRSPDPSLLSPAAMRLARRVPSMASTLDAVLADPLDRALAGVGPVPEVDPTDVRAAVLAGQACADGGGALDPAAMAALEDAARGDAQWWVPAARLHVLSSESREREARMSLSEGDLPYVFPGELNPMMVDALAVGDRVLTALHVDWMRKLTGWIADALVVDLRQRGLLESTLVVWCGEFGRSPDNGIRGGTAYGRDHNAKAMTIWMAGGGVKAGHTIGATDETGSEAVECVHHVRDLHVTLLRLLGLDDSRLTYYHAGRFKQLSQFGGEVIEELLA